MSKGAEEGQIPPTNGLELQLHMKLSKPIFSLLETPREEELINFANEKPHTRSPTNAPTSTITANE
jgi:hypothetical protein